MGKLSGFQESPETVWEIFCVSTLFWGGRSHNFPPILKEVSNPQKPVYMPHMGVEVASSEWQTTSTSIIHQALCGPGFSAPKSPGGS